MTKTLENRIALVTGGQQGIGYSIACAMAEAGADVAICDLEMSSLENAAAEMRKFGGMVVPVFCDVTAPKRVQHMAEFVNQELGHVDILVNNAGVSGSHKFIGHPDDLWHKMLSVNLTGVYNICKAFVPQMADAKWGRIINIASTVAKRGGAYIAAYSASKHGVLGLTRALAVELNRYDITVNAICPGFADTPMNEQTIANIVKKTGRSEEEARQTIEGHSPQNRLISPEEVAALAVMLAGHEARGITGQGINVDGGEVQC